ncbi:MAG: hypothetical protein II777_00655, partial [Clostridia bacterium]|nr:hypothetical protein [Clostridia bacterium]
MILNSVKKRIAAFLAFIMVFSLVPAALPEIEMVMVAEAAAGSDTDNVSSSSQAAGLAAKTVNATPTSK